MLICLRVQKALNIFNAALVTPTYYVYFTSTTIITSAILFQGFKGTAQQIVTVVLGFLTICSGVVLLQLSKAAKDVPDAAVFQGDLDQIHTIAEQEQPESEPKADAIRGTAAIMRRVSKARLRMEHEELRRLHEEKLLDAMQPINENPNQPPEYEWDGLRRRRTMTVGSRRPATASTTTIEPSTTPHPPLPSQSPQPPVSPRSPHPPLGMSRFPEDYHDESDHENENRGNFLTSIAGTIIGRGRSRTTNTLPTYEEEEIANDKARSNVSVPLHDVSSSSAAQQDREKRSRGGYSDAPGDDDEHFYKQDTSYHGAASAGPHNNHSDNSLHAPTLPPHSARRQFSFNRVFRRAQAPTEEERAGLVLGESVSRRDSDDRESAEAENESGRRNAFL